MNQTGTRQHVVNLQTRRLELWLIGLLIIPDMSTFVNRNFSSTAIYAD